jgi:two-component system, NarL family, sensor histidine kinase UhpB
MKLRTRLNLVLIGLTAVSVGVLIADELHDMRSSIREEIEAANRVAAHLLGSLALTYGSAGGLAAVQEQLQKLGHVRANEITLRTASGELLYRAPPPVYKAGREAPAWFARLLAPAPARQVFPIGDDAELIIEAQPSRAILDAWDDFTRLLAIALVMLLVLGGLAFGLVEQALAPFPVIVAGLERLKGGELAYRMPPLPGAEAAAIGEAFNRMAQAVEDKVQAEREAREARSRLEERRELTQVLEQSIEEERRLIAHELHDEFSQSVTAIRSLAMAIATQAGNAAVSEPARLISAEAARLYDAMHGLVPRLGPPSLDTLGLSESLESLVRESQRRHPAPRLSLQQQLPADLGASATLAAYRVVQEGLVNALRHASATRVDIDVRSDGVRMLVAVNDDGVGLPQQWSRPGHFGLRGLAERVERLGGKLTVRNRDPHGVSLTAEIPLVST